MDHNLNAKPKTIKYLEEKTHEDKNLRPWVGKDFLDMKPSITLKEKKGQIGLIKINKVCSSRNKSTEK